MTIKQTTLTTKGQKRNSSIELLKVIGIILIVISHVVQTLSDSNEYITYQDYIVDLTMATTNIQYLILSIFRYFGAMGNNIFFICSCWFLLDSDKSNKRKLLQMFLDIWTISIIILVVTYILLDGNINIKIIIRSFFPTAFNNNWYMTCYLLFYPLHPILNSIIRRLEQTVLLKCTLILVFLYIICNYVKESFFSSRLILWITIYFMIAYMKLYLKDISNNRKLNFVFLLVGIFGNVGMVLLTNYMGLRIEFLQNKLLFWSSNCSPFTILMIIGMFNLARNIKFDNGVINYISKLSLLIYIIHENIILRSYYRPMMWQYIYTNYGYDFVIGWTFVLSILVFIFGLLASVLYKNTIQKIVGIISNKLYQSIIKFYGGLENIILKLH